MSTYCHRSTQTLSHTHPQSHSQTDTVLPTRTHTHTHTHSHTHAHTVSHQWNDIMDNTSNFLDFSFRTLLPQLFQFPWASAKSSLGSFFPSYRGSNYSSLYSQNWSNIFPCFLCKSIHLLFCNRSTVKNKRLCSKKSIEKMRMTQSRRHCFSIFKNFLGIFLSNLDWRLAFENLFFSRAYEKSRKYLVQWSEKELSKCGNFVRKLFQKIPKTNYCKKMKSRMACFCSKVFEVSQ